MRNKPYREISMNSTAHMRGGGGPTGLHHKHPPHERCAHETCTEMAINGCLAIVRPRNLLLCQLGDHQACMASCMVSSAARANFHCSPSGILEVHQEHYSDGCLGAVHDWCPPPLKNPRLLPWHCCIETTSHYTVKGRWWLLRAAHKPQPDTILLTDGQLHNIWCIYQGVILLPYFPYASK